MKIPDIIHRHPIIFSIFGVILVIYMFRSFIRRTIAKITSRFLRYILRRVIRMIKETGEKGSRNAPQSTMSRSIMPALEGILAWLEGSGTQEDQVKLMSQLVALGNRKNFGTTFRPPRKVKRDKKTIQPQ